MYEGNWLKFGILDMLRKYSRHFLKQSWNQFNAIKPDVLGYPIWIKDKVNIITIVKKMNKLYLYIQFLYWIN
jgi:hypothetical protein